MTGVAASLAVLLLAAACGDDTSELETVSLTEPPTTVSVPAAPPDASPVESATSGTAAADPVADQPATETDRGEVAADVTNSTIGQSVELSADSESVEMSEDLDTANHSTGTGPVNPAHEASAAIATGGGVRELPGLEGLTTAAGDPFDDGPFLGDALIPNIAPPERGDRPVNEYLRDLIAYRYISVRLLQYERFGPIEVPEALQFAGDCVGDAVVVTVPETFQRELAEHFEEQIVLFGAYLTEGTEPPEGDAPPGTTLETATFENLVATLDGCLDAWELSTEQFEIGLGLEFEFTDEQNDVIEACTTDMRSDTAFRKSLATGIAQTVLGIPPDEANGFEVVGSILRFMQDCRNDLLLPLMTERFLTGTVTSGINDPTPEQAECIAGAVLDSMMALYGLMASVSEDGEPSAENALDTFDFLVSPEQKCLS